jgi:hypothetical protein
MSLGANVMSEAISDAKGDCSPALRAGASVVAKNTPRNDA